jgi:hypothetical protein
MRLKYFLSEQLYKRSSLFALLVSGEEKKFYNARTFVPTANCHHRRHFQSQSLPALMVGSLQTCANCHHRRLFQSQRLTAGSLQTCRRG